MVQVGKVVQVDKVWEVGWVHQEAKVFYISYIVPRTNNNHFCTDKYQTSIQRKVSYNTYHNNYY